MYDAFMTTTTDDLLAELAELEEVEEDLKELVEDPPPLPTHASTPTRPPAQAPTRAYDDALDERGHKIVALTDLVVEEFDRAIDALSTVRNAVVALREELSPPPGDSLMEYDDEDTEDDLIAQALSPDAQADEDDLEYPDGPNHPPVPR